VSPGRGTSKPEYDDVARVAKITGLPLREVRFRAERAWRDTSGPDDEPA
jgi:uncharacterized protein (DUF111 family)